MNAHDIGPVSMEKVDGSHPVRKLAEGGKWLQSARTRMKKKAVDEGKETRFAGKRK